MIERGTYSAALAAEATSAATATATETATTVGPLATLGAFAISRLGLASQLDRNPTLEDLLSRELLDGRGGLTSCGKVHEGITDRAVSTRVHRDGGAFTVIEFQLDMYLQ